MALVKTVSKTYKIDSSIVDVYSLLSDFDRIGLLLDLARGTGARNATAKKYAEVMENLHFSKDSCVITVKRVGDFGIRIVEKNAPNLIKMKQDERFPFEFSLWVQLLENGPLDTRIRLTLEADVNLLMKFTLKGKIGKGLDQLAEGISKFPYSILGMMP